MRTCVRRVARRGRLPSRLAVVVTRVCVLATGYIVEQRVLTCGLRRLLVDLACAMPVRRDTVVAYQSTPSRVCVY